MDVIPVWRAAHHFVDHASDSERFTYGLASVELVEQQPGTEPALKRWGAEWYASLPAALRDGSATTALEKELEAHNVGPHARGFTRATITPELEQDFAERTWPALAELMVDLTPLVEPLIAAADVAEAPPEPTPEQNEKIARFLEIYARRRYELRAFADGRWFIRPDDLLARIALEVADLRTTRPRMRRCRLCGRAFAMRPGKRAAICSTHVWSWPGAELQSYCNPDAAAAEIARMESETDAVSDPEADRTRQRKTLHARVTRALKAADGDDADAVYLHNRKKYDEFMAENRRRPGRPAQALDAFDPEDEIEPL